MTKQNKGRKLFAVSASAALVASAIVPVASANADFTDASKISSWAKEAVEYFVENGVINGYEDGSFKPGNSVKRGEAAKMFATALDYTADEESDLTDVSGHWAEEYINAVAANGIVNGYEDGSFKPEKTLTRAETAKMIVTAYGFEEEGDISKFKDVAGHWSEEYIALAVGAGVLNGVSATEVAPDANVTREQFAAMLYRAEQTKDTEPEYTLEDALADLEAAQADAEEFEEVTEENLEEAQEAAAALASAIEAVEEFESEDEEVLEQIEAAKEVLAALEEKIEAAEGGEPVDGVIAQVSAINGTTVEVTLEEAVSAAPAASAFSIPGLTISKVEIKPESDNRVLVLTTSAQTVTTYNLTYAGQTVPFIGKNALGTVLLKADKERVEIDPNLNTLPTVDIQVELSTDFPAGAEAVIEFQTSFGQVVKVQTTKGGKTSFTLTPEKTLFSQVARVTGKVVEVKNPTTGETYPDYRNATVNTVNVQFDVKPNNQTDTVEVFQFSTAYAEQADRVVLRVDGSGVTDSMQKTLNAAPLAKVAALTTENIAGQQNLDANAEVAKEFYTLLHDVLYSNISGLVADENTKYVKGIQNKEQALKAAETSIVDYLDKVKPQDLRNILYKDVIGVKTVDGKEVADNRFATVYQPLGATQAGLYAAVNAISDAEFQDIIKYYKLLSKFVVLDNVRDTAAPQSPNNIFAVEHVYAADNKTLVLVLAGDRSSENRNLAAKRFEQKRDVTADYLQDNVSHQVRFLNNIEKDRYQLTGAPTFKLEDANNVELIAVDSTSKAVRYKAGSPTGAAAGINYCPTPFAVDVKQDTIVGGGTTVTTPNKYIGTALAAKNYTISDYFMKTEGPSIQNDKLGEVLVVFSESVSTEEGYSNVLDPKNWVVDGVNLAEAAKEFGGKVQIRLVSTDVRKQLRDAVIITFASDNVPTGKPVDTANKPVYDTTLIQKFIEKAVYGTNHKLEVSKLGDWAAETDNKNIVPTQTLDYAARTEATQWGTVTTQPTTNTGTAALLPNTNAFVVRAAGQADITAAGKGIATVPNGAAYQYASVDDKDIVRILFSEPMQLDGAQSVLNKENYKINGKELPVEGTSIRVGLEGVAGFENSPCAVTIQLPNGTLTNVADGGYDNSNGNDNIIAVSNVRGLDDTSYLQEDLQLAYARQLTLVGSGNAVTINGKVITADGLFNDKIASHKDVASIEKRVYRDIKGNVIEFSNTWVNSANFFIGHPLNAEVNVATPTTAQAAALAALENAQKALKAAQVEYRAAATQAEKDAAKAKVNAAQAAIDAALAQYAGGTAPQPPTELETALSNLNAAAAAVPAAAAITKENAADAQTKVDAAKAAITAAKAKGATDAQVADAQAKVDAAQAKINEVTKPEEGTGVVLSTIAANGANKTAFGTYVSAVDGSKLTGNLAGATSLTLVIGNKEYKGAVNGTYFLFTVPEADVADAAAVLAGKVIAK